VNVFLSIDQKFEHKCVFVRTEVSELQAAMKRNTSVQKIENFFRRSNSNVLGSDTFTGDAKEAKSKFADT